MFDILGDDKIFNLSRVKSWEVLSPETLETIESFTSKELALDTDRNIYRRLFSAWRED